MLGKKRCRGQEVGNDLSEMKSGQQTGLIFRMSFLFYPCNVEVDPMGRKIGYDMKAVCVLGDG